jgi:CRP-like cAMP-binding protein
MKHIIDQITESPLFKGVEPAALEAMLKVMTPQTFPANTTIFRKGDPGDSMYILTSGKMRIFTTDAEGNEIVLTYFEPVRVFGDFSLLDRQPRSASAGTVNEIEVLVLSRDTFLNFLPQYPSVGLAMLRNLADRVRYITNYMNKIGDLAQRLSSGEYDRIIAEITQSTEGADDSDIKGLISAFVKMVYSVKEREEQANTGG